MPILIEHIHSDGALVDVRIGWSVARARRLRATLQPVPPAVTARSVLDTGAEVSCLDSALVQSLGLPLGGTVLVNLPAHGGITGGVLYNVSLTIIHPSGNARDNLVVRDLAVLEIGLSSLGYQMLIGRDVLKQCRFLYDGPAKRFELRY